jgi:hypothetical protein
MKRKLQGQAQQMRKQRLKRLLFYCCNVLLMGGVKLWSYADSGICRLGSFFTGYTRTIIQKGRGICKKKGENNLRIWKRYQVSGSRYQDFLLTDCRFAELIRKRISVQIVRCRIVSFFLNRFSDVRPESFRVQMSAFFSRLSDGRYQIISLSFWDNRLF